MNHAARYELAYVVRMRALAKAEGRLIAGGHKGPPRYPEPLPDFRFQLLRLARHGLLINRATAKDLGITLPHLWWLAQQFAKEGLLRIDQRRHAEWHFSWITAAGAVELDRLASADKTEKTDKTRPR